MKKFSILLITATMLASAAGCTSSTAYGPCVGIADESKDPSKFYKISGWNLAMGIIFVETIVVPVVVAADQFWCPVGNKYPSSENKNDKI